MYHGLPEELYHFEPRRGDYLAFLGRISPEKRLDRAIEIAGRTGYRLRVAATIHRADRDYFTETIAPLMRQPSRVHELSRATCRRVFEQRFTAARMTQEYVSIYRRLLDHTHDGRDQPDPSGRTSSARCRGSTSTQIVLDRPILPTCLERLT